MIPRVARTPSPSRSQRSLARTGLTHRCEKWRVFPGATDHDDTDRSPGPRGRVGLPCRARDPSLVRTEERAMVRHGITDRPSLRRRRAALPRQRPLLLVDQEAGQNLRPVHGRLRKLRRGPSGDEGRPDRPHRRPGPRSVDRFGAVDRCGGHGRPRVRSRHGLLALRTVQRVCRRQRDALTVTAPIRQERRARWRPMAGCASAPACDA